MKKEAIKSMDLTPESLEEDLRQEAKILNLPKATTDIIVSRAVAKVMKWLEGRPAVTEGDLNRKLASEIQNYSPDLAYVYQNRGKII